jgi:hypothetical protein
MAKYGLILALMAGMALAYAASAPPAIGPAAGAASLATGSPFAPNRPSAAQIAVEGWVKDIHNKPVSGSVVALDGRQTGSDSTGYFHFTTTQLANAPAFSSDVDGGLTVAVTAPGHAGWTISGARYYRGDTLRLYPRLADAGQAPTVVKAAQTQMANRSPVASFAATRPGDLSREALAGANRDPTARSGHAGIAASAQSPSPALPAQIRVYRTATGVVEVVPFKDYVKHVLPNEWVSTWPADSLRSGAMAVKEYGWYWVAMGGKQPALGADVKDNTDDQVYDPNVSYASTDAAVDATWQYAMTLNGSQFQASYCAGTYQADPSADCPWDQHYMTQWGSKYYADQGKSWSWILEFYFPGLVISPSPPGGGGSPPTPQAPARSTFTVGQGATQPSIFQDAYDRNGGEAVLGRPTGAVHWWLQYLSDNNVLEQPFSGGGGNGGVWLVFDILKSNTSGISRAYAISGNIANAYANHDPPGPEWLGAPTSDAYTSSAGAGGLVSQGFTRGTLAVNAGSVQYTAWPGQFNGWEADYFVGKPPDAMQAGPALDLPGQPANVADVPKPDMNWPIEAAVPGSLGVGKVDWSAQFTRVMQVNPGTYDFSLTADSGLRLWIDGLLAINAWTASGSHTETYEADLDSSPHTVRVQYFSPDGKAQLTFSMNARSSAQPAPTQPAIVEGPSAPGGSASLRVKVNWLGRAPAPNDSWVQPLTLQLSAPGNPAIIGSYRGMTDSSGVATFGNLPVGTFDVHVKGLHSLQSARASIAMPPGVVTDVDMKSLIEGDVDGDNCVTVDDFALVQAMVGTDKNTPGFDPRADLNGDGRVTVADVSLLRSGFDRCGDISADNDLYAMSSDASPGSAPDWSPWLNPAALHNDLSLSLYAGATTVRQGDLLQVQVVAGTGAQAIDGGSFLLTYDPALLAPVDSSGNPVSASEPGLALPSVLTNWVDTKGGVIGYAAGMLQGDPPAGQVVLTTLTFRALHAGSAALHFAPLTSGYMELTNGGVNLLAKSHDLTLNVTP